MSTTTLCCPTPDTISVGGKTFYPNPGKTCFVCDPPHAHARAWRPDPDSHEREGRTLVLCFDGTGDTIDGDCTNVVQFMTMLMRDDSNKQVVYYQPGIGTYTKNAIKTPILEATTKLQDQMFARSLGDHVKEGYKFLMENYRSGDQICLFGFSRGAFTARALAGMVQKVGILPPRNIEQLQFAFAVYQMEDDVGLEQSLQFKRSFSAEVRIKFIGVWDTVESVGLFEKRLPFCVSDNAIEYFRHAVALDERRIKFTPTYFHAASQHEKTGGVPCELKHRVDGLHVNATDVEEVFFAGAHCDVGGGSVPNGERFALARIPLRWMIRECFKANTGIIFDSHMLKHEIGLDIGEPGSTLAAPTLPPSTTQYLARPKPEPKPKAGGTSVQDMLTLPFKWMWGTSKPSNVDSPKIPGFGRETAESEPHEELNDAVSLIYDQLSKTHWKAMQYMPSIVRSGCGDKDGLKINWSGSDLTEGRVMDTGVIERHVKVHRSVKIRILAKPDEGDSYLPAMHFRVGKDVRKLKPEEWLAENPTYFRWVE